ncbi:MAG TPA: Ig-like domain-containing protein, partial [Longimicrobiales bacterium]|nr:Ig-like domain-containing protein [Longimicrobiales bacterium]
MPRLRSPWPTAVALCSLAWLACDDPIDPTSRVAEVVVEPETGSLDIADTLRLSATAFSAAGEPIDDPGLTWRSASADATVDAAGLVTGVGPGSVLVEAVSSNGTIGSALVRITPVTAIEPDSGRFGQVVTIRGVGLHPATTVFFTGATGRVPAFTRQGAADALEVWVPVGARTGTLELAWPGDAVVTSRAFRLTAEQDVYAGTPEPAEIPFPFANPSLLAGGGATHAFRFTIAEATPFALHLADHGAAFPETAARAWLFRVDPQPSTLVSFLMTREHLNTGARLDSVAYSRTSLPAGDYVLMVAALDLVDAGNTDVQRPFGIRLAAAEAFARAPDPHEPNDFPAEAPVVSLPFAAAGLGAENPYAMDHYAFEVADSGTVTITATAASPLLLLYLLPDGPQDILAAWESDAVLAGADGALAAQQVQATVPAGRYTALVWDWAGHARPYDLEITAAAAAAATAGDPDAGVVGPARA